MRFDDMEFMKCKNMLEAIEQSSPPPSRADIAKRLGFSRTTASQIANRLFELRLIAEASSYPEDDSNRSVGRPGHPLVLDTSKWLAVGAVFHQPLWDFAAIDLLGTVVYRHTESVDDLTPENYVGVLLSGLRHMRTLCGNRMLGSVGIGTPGLVDEETGMIVHIADLGWTDIPLGALLGAALGIPVRVMNRHQASGLAEHRFGSGKGLQDMVYIGLGTGISSAIFSGGKIIHGARHGAGSIGHTTIDLNGRPCNCGRRGCLQMYATGKEIEREVRARVVVRPETNDRWSIYHRKEDITLEVISALAEAKDPIVIGVLQETAHALAIAIGNIIKLLNPERIIIGGPIERSFKQLVPFIAEDLMANPSFDSPVGAVSITSSSLDIYSGAIGAAILVTDRKLELLQDL